jgi:predicted regulator of Ras-like GTPase activity (Roadblock/LC7/MglB family)
MPPGAVSWSFTDDDFQAISGSLQRFLYDSNARCALLVDRAGQLVATVGEPPAFDATAFASLTAADFSANDQLAKLIGERDFTTLFHQGEKESMFLADVARRIILVVLFDDRTTLGLVRLKLKGIVDELARRFELVFARGATPATPAGTPGAGARGMTGALGAQPAPLDLLAGAEDEIDRLFS